MWPWDHLAVGYLVVSLWRRYRSGRPLGETEAVAVVVGSQLPDLVDKPLGWGTTLLPSGTSLAHSLPVAVWTSVFVYLLTRWFDRGDVGAAFALAYLAHLPADVVYPVIIGRSPAISFLFWPLVEQPSSQIALSGYVLDLLVQFVDFLRTPRGLTFLVAEATLMLVTFALWRQDGYPVLGLVRRVVDPRCWGASLSR